MIEKEEVGVDGSDTETNTIKKRSIESFLFINLLCHIIKHLFFNCDLGTVFFWRYRQMMLSLENASFLLEGKDKQRVFVI